VAVLLFVERSTNTYLMYLRLVYRLHRAESPLLCIISEKYYLHVQSLVHVCSTRVQANSNRRYILIRTYIAREYCSVHSSTTISSIPVFLPAVNSKKRARLSFVLDLLQHILAVSCCFKGQHHANYINALAVSVSPFFEPAEVTLGGLIFSPWVDFL
jgi:hypothetical protein